MKKWFLLISFTVFVFAFTSGMALGEVIHVTLTYVDGQLVRTPPGPYPKSAGDSFEVTNDTDFPVHVQLYDADDHMHGNMVVGPGETDALPLQCIERWVCYDYTPGLGGGTTDFVCDQMIPIDDDWPNHKMHYPQRPDPNGWDVMCTGNVSLPNATMLADDFQCSETGYIEDIHFWGSWKDDIEGQVVMFHLAIHENIPEGPGGYSIPGAELWFAEIYEPEYIVTPVDPPGDQGWYDPITGEVLPHNHQFYFRYDVFLPEDLWFWQTEGEIYWLRIVAFVDDPSITTWGWKTSMDPQFMDDAVFDSYVDPIGWQELYEPEVIPDPIINNAGIVLDAQGQMIDYYTDEDAYELTWWWYENTGWWNVWWYDHPFDPTRMKHLFMSGWVINPWENPGYVEIAFNWSTPDWPPGYPPPIPPLDPAEEEQFIRREIIFSGELAPGQEIPIEGFYEIWDYNPEWVSMDIRGFNVLFEAELTHQCLPRGEPESLDLAFVITGELEEPVYDLWETPEGHNTFVDFGCPAIPPLPADFFGPGSDPFDGRIDFRGDPLETSPPGVLGPTDTIIKRNRAASLPDCPSTDGPIETEIVALNLVSVQPITVTYGGTDPEDWDVKMCLSESVPQPVGTTTFNRICQEGGTFTAYIPMAPMFVFTRISDGSQVFYDFGAAGLTIEYDVPDANWLFIDSFFDVYVAGGDELVSNCDDVPDIAIGPSAVDLIPGLQAIPCDNCTEPPIDHLIPITAMIEPSQCAEQDIWPPHDVLEPIPTLSEWGILILALLLLLTGTIAVIRKRKEVIARSK